MSEDLYQYTDKSGNLVISNKNIKGSVKLDLKTTTRQKILQEELEHEQLALKKSKKLQEDNLTKNKADLYLDDIATHEKNINVLTKQLNQEG